MDDVRLLTVLETVARAMELHAEAQATFATSVKDLAQELSAFRVGLRDQAELIKEGQRQHLEDAARRRQEALDHAATVRAAAQRLMDVRQD